MQHRIQYTIPIVLQLCIQYCTKAQYAECTESDLKAKNKVTALSEDAKKIWKETAEEELAKAQRIVGFSGD